MNFERHCWAEIDLDALRDNFKLVQATVGGPVCAVVKADAYGHGVQAAQALQESGAAAFAVSCLSEARNLRRHGIDKPILILGYTDPQFAVQLAADGITQAVFSGEYAAQLSDAAVTAQVTVDCHLKIDTGMGRIGFAVGADFAGAVAAMAACYHAPGLHVTGTFQHFAVADSAVADDETYTEQQYALFRRTIEALQRLGCDPGTVHCANSAAQMRHPEWRCDLTRAGIILYGLNPSDEVKIPGLRPVMTLKARVTHIKTLAPGQSVSYGRTYIAETAPHEPVRAATICVGYADGYPRLLSGGRGVMLVNGRPAPVLGRVCMDQTIVDVTGIPDLHIGDEVVVFGPLAEGVADTADTIAAKTDTIPYEIICGVARRIPRVYLQNGAPVHIWNDLEET